MLPNNPLVDLHLIFKKSSSTDQVQKIKFNELDFTVFVACKNPVLNRLKIQFIKLDFSNLIIQKSSTDQQGEYLDMVRMPERIYNFHYGNGVPPMFTS